MLAQQLRYCFVRHHLGQAVRAEQKDVAGRDIGRRLLQQHRLFQADGARDHAPEHRGQILVVGQTGRRRNRVIRAQLLQPALAVAVGAAVAGMQHPRPFRHHTVKEQHHHRAARAVQATLLGAGLNPLAGPIHGARRHPRGCGCRHGKGCIRRYGKGITQGVDRRLARHLAALHAAHAVGHAEHARLRHPQHSVLVVPALSPDVRHLCRREICKHTVHGILLPRSAIGQADRP